MERLFLIIGTIAAVVTAVPAIFFLWDRFRPQPRGQAMADPASAPDPAQTRRRWLGLLFAVLSALFLGATVSGIWFWTPLAALGFDAGWPDAIRCQITERGQVTRSGLIFYSQGTSGDAVVVYFLAGGYNPPEGYSPHEVRFRKGDGSLVLPDDAFKANPQDRYVGAFKDIAPVKCAGPNAPEAFTIKDVIDAGNGFSFARKFQP